MQGSAAVNTPPMPGMVTRVAEVLAEMHSTTSGMLAEVDNHRQRLLGPEPASAPSSIPSAIGSTSSIMEDLIRLSEQLNRLRSRLSFL